MGELEDLAQRAVADPVAMHELLATVEPQLLRRCRRILADPLDAEEACQDALTSLSRRLGTFDGRSQLSTWLHRIATNAALDTHRRVSRRRSTVVLAVDPQAPGALSEVVSSREAVLDGLGRIDERLAEAVVLRDLLGLDYGEIATTLDVPVGTVKSRIHEGRRRLQAVVRP